MTNENFNLAAGLFFGAVVALAIFFIVSTTMAINDANMFCMLQDGQLAVKSSSGYVCVDGIPVP